MKALVIGTGKFGTNVCKNLLHYLPQLQLHICNRTNEKSEELAAQLQAGYLPFDELAASLNAFDVIITSTAAPEPIVLPQHFVPGKQRLIVDLSVPANVHKDVAKIDGIEMANVDEISAILEQTIARRHMEVPKAEAIIAEFEQEFYEWLHTYKHTPAIKLVKQHLAGWARQTGCEFSGAATTANPEVDALLKQTVNNLMVNLKHKSEKGCHVIAAYEQFLNHPALSVEAS